MSYYTKWNILYFLGIYMHACTYSDWANTYDSPENFYVPNDYVLTGVMSRHSNHYEYALKIDIYILIVFCFKTVGLCCIPTSSLKFNFSNAFYYIPANEVFKGVL